jgi:radical SAM protein with 4Fe4S-binding SPASM domain
MRYVWIHLPCGECPPDSADDRPKLSLDEWLDIVDEAAANGARSLIISIGNCLARQPFLLDVCRWAQSTHGMLVGIHAYEALDPADAAVLRNLEVDRTRIFVDSEHIESARFAERMGFKVYCADSLEESSVSAKCELPSTMTCVGSDGNLYTCGLVLGQEQFRLAHFFERQLRAVHEDETLPHTIPEGVPAEKHRCNGCPPLMAQKVRDDGF